MKRLALLALFMLGLSVPTEAANVYVRQGSAGADNGTDWTNAYAAMPILVRGNIYFIADGSYAALTITTAVSGVTTIVLKHATIADHGTSTGWVDTYGDGTGTFVNLLISTKYIDVYRLNFTDYISANAGAGNPNTVAFLNFYSDVSKVVFIVGQDILFSGGSYGGYDACTVGAAEDIVDVWDNGIDTASSRITFDGVTVHDLTDHGNSCAGLPNDGIHSDCMQILGGHTITVKNSLFYNCSTSDILGASFRDTLDGLVLENNWFQTITHPGTTLSFTGLTGTNSISYNTILGFAGVSGSGITFNGNILSVGSCGTATYTYNLFVEGGVTCGTNIRSGTPGLISSPTPGYLNDLVPNYHLTGGDVIARDRGNPAVYPATDKDGDVRFLDVAPDLGADESLFTGDPAPPVALTNSLTAYFPLNEASGNAIDSVAANNLTDNNAVAATTGKVGGGRDLEFSSSQFFSRVDDATYSLAADTDFAIIVWAKLESKLDFGGIFTRYINGSGTADEFVLDYKQTTDRFRLYVGNGAAFQQVEAATLGSPALATWYFIVAWHDSTTNTLNIQVNNGTVDSAVWAGGTQNTAATTRLGLEGVSYFDGVLDECGYWKGRFLSSTERTWLYNSGNGRSYTEIQAGIGGAGHAPVIGGGYYD